MKTLLIVLFITSLGTEINWLTDMDTAKKQAKAENKLVLLYISGSDWCIHCINTKKEIFESEDFKKYASNNLVLINADFPRKKKNKLSEEQKKKNEALADLYDPKGQFPIIVLLNTEGKELRRWEGKPQGTVADFIKEINGCPK